ncbi:gamma-D-glutamate-meso-diaminopimelate muropeptidase [Leuconostoc litchii]|uniref:Peptidoglycan endopeptidase n=1 Tax=Leuconostoc litchii TaxID=1981069 RepID=A0A6P2CR00_9LACO|nr:C40 family peptidase [Leuconostoc litchii]TYC47291.1 peptidoglycan endopeptidase [Leuconostoc litchii]GMA69282.1 gamma-D-glutamate-meso-diaminopimelate muropeptidase [Leuconostoc litchii]
MERLDKKVVASGLSLLGLVGIGSGIAHADDVKNTVGKAVNSVAEAAGLMDNSAVNLTQKSLTIPKDKVAHIETPAEKKIAKSVSVKSTSYKVKSGDSLWSIAQNHNLNVEDLVSENNDSDLISVGQTLSLPAANNSSVTTSVADLTTDTHPDAAPLKTAANVTVDDNSSTSKKESSSSSSMNSSSSDTIKTDETAGTSSSAATSSSSTASESTTTDDAMSDASNGKNDGSSAKVSIGDTSITNSSSSENTTNSSITSENVANTDANVADPSKISESSSNSSTDDTKTDSESATSIVAKESTLSSSATDTGVVNLSTGTQNIVSNPTGITVSSTNRSSAVIALAQQLVSQNIPYVWGGSTPSTGFDCSGLVSYVFQNAAGVSLPHSSVSQEMYTKKKLVSQAQPGDLLFWGTPGASYHDAIYIGNNQYIAAPEPGLNVRVETISDNFMPTFAGEVK